MLAIEVDEMEDAKRVQCEKTVDHQHAHLFDGQASSTNTKPQWGFYWLLKLNRGIFLEDSGVRKRLEETLTKSFSDMKKV